MNIAILKQKIEVVGIAFLCIAGLLALGYGFQYAAVKWSPGLFKCAATATCSMIAQIIIFLTLYLMVPSEWLERLAYIASPSNILNGRVEQKV